MKTAAIIAVCVTACATTTLPSTTRVTRTSTPTLTPADPANEAPYETDSRTREAARGAFAFGALLTTMSILQARSALRWQDQAEYWYALPHAHMVDENYRDAVDQRNSQRTLAVISGLGAAASIGAGVYLFERGPTTRQRSRRAPWYGWKILVTDGVALGMGLLAFATYSDEPNTSDALQEKLIILGGIAWAAAPFVHVTEDQIGNAMTSGVLRYGSAYLATRNDVSFNLAAGLLLGSMLLDYTLLSFRPDVKVTPVPLEHGGAVSVGGRF